VIQSELWAEEGRLLNDPNNERWTTSGAASAQQPGANRRSGLHQRRQDNRNPDPDRRGPRSDGRLGHLGHHARSDHVAVGQKKIIEGINREELDYRYPNWENWTSGEPSLYWFDGSNAKINLVANRPRRMR
jgi:hypothetical protein